MARIKMALVGASTALAMSFAFAGTAQAGCGHSVTCSVDSQPIHNVHPVPQHAPGLSSSGPREPVMFETYPPKPIREYAPGLSSSGPRIVGAYQSDVVVGTPYAAPGLSSSGPRNYGISEAYTLDTDISHSATISSYTIPGLGANERLCPTSCGSSGVQGGGKVLGCYAVCKPAPKPVTTTVLTRVVHPVYYVPYPVCAAPACAPAPVVRSPVCTAGPRVSYSRYGSYGYGCR